MPLVPDTQPRPPGEGTSTDVAPEPIVLRKLSPDYIVNNLITENDRLNETIICNYKDAKIPQDYLIVNMSIAYDSLGDDEGKSKIQLNVVQLYQDGKIAKEILTGFFDEIGVTEIETADGESINISEVTRKEVALPQTKQNLEACVHNFKTLKGKKRTAFIKQFASDLANAQRHAYATTDVADMNPNKDIAIKNHTKGFGNFVNLMICTNGFTEGTPKSKEIRNITETFFELAEHCLESGDFNSARQIHDTIGKDAVANEVIVKYTKIQKKHQDIMERLEKVFHPRGSYEEYQNQVEQFKGVYLPDVSKLTTDVTTSSENYKATPDDQSKFQVLEDLSKKKESMMAVAQHYQQNPVDSLEYNTFGLSGLSEELPLFNIVRYQLIAADGKSNFPTGADDNEFISQNPDNPDLVKDGKLVEGKKLNEAKKAFAKVKLNSLMPKGGQQYLDRLNKPIVWKKVKTEDAMSRLMENLDQFSTIDQGGILYEMQQRGLPLHPKLSAINEKIAARGIPLEMYHVLSGFDDATVKGEKIADLYTKTPDLNLEQFNELIDNEEFSKNLNLDQFMTGFMSDLMQREGSVAGDFLKDRVRYEVMNAPRKESLLRQNSLFSKAFKTFSHETSQTFVKGILPSVIEAANKAGDLEVDPDKITTQEGIDKEEEALKDNQDKLLNCVQEYLGQTLDNVDKLPIEVAAVLKELSKAIMVKFNNDSETARIHVAGQIFLRLLNPAIMTYASKPENKDAYRGLLLMTKIAQNAANKTKKVKEPFLKFAQDKAGGEFEMYMGQIVFGLVGELFDEDLEELVALEPAEETVTEKRSAKEFFRDLDLGIIKHSDFTTDELFDAMDELLSAEPERAEVVEPDVVEEPVIAEEVKPTEAPEQSEGEKIENWLDEILQAHTEENNYLTPFFQIAVVRDFNKMISQFTQNQLEDLQYLKETWNTRLEGEGLDETISIPFQIMVRLIENKIQSLTPEVPEPVADVTTGVIVEEGVSEGLEFTPEQQAKFDQILDKINSFTPDRLNEFLNWAEGWRNRLITKKLQLEESHSPQLETEVRIIEKVVTAINAKEAELKEALSKVDLLIKAKDYKHEDFAIKIDENQMPTDPLKRTVRAFKFFVEDPVFQAFGRDRMASRTLPIEADRAFSLPDGSVAARKVPYLQIWKSIREGIKPIRESIRSGKTEGIDDDLLKIAKRVAYQDHLDLKKGYDRLRQANPEDPRLQKILEKMGELEVEFESY